MTYGAAALPSAQPTSGVIASITPKIRPVRSASRMRGRFNVAALPTAAAKASGDMAKAVRMVEAIFMGTLLIFGSGQEHAMSRQARPVTALHRWSCQPEYRSVAHATVR